MGANFQAVRSATAAQAGNSGFGAVVNNAVQNFAKENPGPATAGTASTAAPVSLIGGVPSPIASAVDAISPPSNTAKRSLLG